MGLLIAETLRDIAEESALNKPEKQSLRLIAKDVDAMGDENIRLMGIINTAFLKCPSQETELIEILEQGPQSQKGK